MKWSNKSEMFTFDPSVNEYQNFSKTKIVDGKDLF